MNCPFCNFNKKEMIFEGKKVFVCLSNPRLVKGHLLVISKRHVQKLSELDENERKELFDVVIKFQEKILKKFSKGCDVRQNYRPFQKQNKLKIDHLHVHLQPREFKDELYEKCQIFETSIFRELVKDEKDKILKSIN